jgi:Ca2+-binding EF-hand superfamily protein
MEKIDTLGYINREDLIYWIDKQFVQETAQERIGRSLDEEELNKLVKLIENGLWHVVFDTVKMAIDEVQQG